MTIEELEGYKSSAEQYNPDGLYALGLAYANPPEGVEKNLDEALWNFTASVWEARKKGRVHAVGAFKAGVLLYYGTGNQIDTKAAYHYWMMAAEGGNIMAMYLLGRYHIGDDMENGCGYPRIPSVGVAYLKAAAEGGQASAAFAVAECYRTGNGVVSSRYDELEWMTKAAQLGNVNAMYNCGVINEEYYDYNAAGQWFYMAAQQGSTDAERALGGYTYSRITGRWKKLGA